jgi:DNA-binding beta-propeller fold protein YncE
VHGAGTRVVGMVIGALTATALAACSSAGIASGSAGGGQLAQPAAVKPQQIFAAPKNLLAAGQPQPNGTLWALAGNAASKGLFAISLANGSGIGSVSVSNAARSVTESLGGVIGLALGSARTGALELLNGSTGKVTTTIPLGAPARDAVVGADGATFYVLNGTAKSASVTVVNSRDGGVQGTVPVPVDTVSIAPDAMGASLYALQPDGQVSQVAIAGGQVMTSFATGAGARSIALSPDGSTLYVLKDAGQVANVAEVKVATESVQQVLPAPANCLQVLVSADGSQLYQLVGTSSYGNIQVFKS